MNRKKIVLNLVSLLTNSWGTGIVDKVREYNENTGKYEITHYASHRQRDIENINFLYSIKVYSDKKIIIRETARREGDKPFNNTYIEGEFNTILSAIHFLNNLNGS